MVALPLRGDGPRALGFHSKIDTGGIQMDAYKVARFVIRLYAVICLVSGCAYFLFFACCLVLFRFSTDALQRILASVMWYAFNYAAIAVTGSIALLLLSDWIAGFAAKAWNSQTTT